MLPKIVTIGVYGTTEESFFAALRDAGVDTPMRTFGLPQEFLEHGKREEILADAGLVPQHLARGITEAVARLTPELEHHTPS